MKRCPPEAVGIQPDGILAFIQDMQKQKIHLHALMILRHGQVCAESHFAPWNNQDKHMLYSLSKSFTSTALGFAVQDGLCTLEDSVIGYFPEYLPAQPCENMQKLRIRHLLTMNTGHEKEPPLNGPCWEKNFLQSYIAHEPGTYFLYNTAATYMLSAIIQKITGKKLLQYLREKLLIPLGMSSDIWFEESPTGIAAGGFGLNVRIEDIARLGQFYLQEGAWQGKQLLSRDWIRNARSAWSDSSRTHDPTSDWGAGYGYQFWMCQPKNVYRGDGAFGQYCIILPDQDMVIAMNSGVTNMGAVMQSLWTHVLPAVDTLSGQSALSRIPEHYVSPAYWEEHDLNISEPIPDETWTGDYRLLDNPLHLEEIRVSRDALDFMIEGQPSRIPLCSTDWTPCTLTRSDPSYLSGGYTHNPGFYQTAYVRASRRGQSLYLHFCYTETPFEDIFLIDFSDHGIQLHQNRLPSASEISYSCLGIRITD